LLSEAAAILRIGERWLEDGVRAGRLPHRKLAGRTRFAAEDLAEILTMCEQRPVEDSEPERLATDVAVLGATRRSAARQRKAS
jgi:hypothetical protein